MEMLLMYHEHVADLYEEDMHVIAAGISELLGD